jgi:hypothetical protein
MIIVRDNTHKYVLCRWVIYLLMHLYMISLLFSSIYFLFVPLMYLLRRELFYCLFILFLSLFYLFIYWFIYLFVCFVCLLIRNSCVSRARSISGDVEWPLVDCEEIVHMTLRIIHTLHVRSLETQTLLAQVMYHTCYVGQWVVPNCDDSIASPMFLMRRMWKTWRFCSKKNDGLSRCSWNLHVRKYLLVSIGSIDFSIKYMLNYLATRTL